MNTTSNRYSQGQGRSVTKRLANENDPTAKRPRKQRGPILSQQSVQSAGSSNSRAVKTPTSKEILSDNQVGILEPAIVVKLVAHVILEVVQTTRIDHVIHGRFSNVVIDEEYNVNAPENAKVKKHPSFFIMIITINRVTVLFLQIVFAVRSLVNALLLEKPDREWAHAFNEAMHYLVDMGYFNQNQAIAYLNMDRSYVGSSKKKTAKDCFQDYYIQVQGKMFRRLVRNLGLVTRPGPDWYVELMRNKIVGWEKPSRAGGYSQKLAAVGQRRVFGYSFT